MIYWCVREDGWIVDYTNAESPGYTALPEGIAQADLAAWPNLWYIDGVLVARDMPTD